jgi:hypothetical protein
MVLVDILEQEKTTEAFKQAVEVCNWLETKTDSIHKKYWSYRGLKFKKLLEAH